MRCPECGNDKTVTRSTQTDDDGETVRRYRRCLACGCKFVTYECYERADVEAPFEVAELRVAINQAISVLSVKLK